jgi:energy-coupling factor transport system permease protein
MDKASIDPRARLSIVVSLTTLAVLFNTVVSLSLLLAATTVICLFLGLAGMKAAFRSKWLFGFFVFVAAVQSVFNAGGSVVLAVKGITLLSVGGIELGVCFLCRMAVIIFSSGIIAAAGSRKMIQGLVALKIPYEIAFMATTALSFLPMIAADMRDSLTALQLRGVELGKLPFRRKLTVYGYLITPVIEGIVVKAKELSCAMEMRAFRAYKKRSSYVVLSLGAKDYLIIALAFAGVVVGLWLYS